jgi:hypothetical protein
MTPEEFKKLSIEQKLELVKARGDFVASRLYPGFNVHLFALDGFFIEVWKRVGLDYIQWIEVVNSDSTINSYLDNINLE